MKHLRLFESFREEDIRAICREYDIINYTINEDGSIDVDGCVYLYRQRLNSLPLNFRNVTGGFDCSYNNLTSLEGSPKSVNGSFHCIYNKLKSLKGCSKSVSGDFACSYNKLTSLEGCPKSVGGYFTFNNNKIVTFEHLPPSDELCCDDNPIWQVWKLFKDCSKIEFLNDCDALREPDENSEEPIIILDRLNYFLEEIGEKTVKSVKGYKCI